MGWVAPWKYLIVAIVVGVVAGEALALPLGAPAWGGARWALLATIVDDA